MHAAAWQHQLACRDLADAALDRYHSSAGILREIFDGRPVPLESGDRV